MTLDGVAESEMRASKGLVMVAVVVIRHHYIPTVNLVIYSLTIFGSVQVVD